MSLYKVLVKKSVQKDLRKISSGFISKLLLAMEALASNQHPPNSRKLVGSEKTYRVRVGDYRLIYTCDDLAKEIEVQKVSHCKNAYR